MTTDEGDEGDQGNYGDEGDTGALISPSISAHYGITEADYYQVVNSNCVCTNQETYS